MSYCCKSYIFKRNVYFFSFGSCKWRLFCRLSCFSVLQSLSWSCPLQGDRDMCVFPAAALMLPLPASVYRLWLDSSGPQEPLGSAPQGCLVLGPCTEDVLRACPLGVSLATCKSRRQRGGWAPAVFPPGSVTWKKPVRRQPGALSRGVETFKDAGDTRCPGL